MCDPVVAQIPAALGWVTLNLVILSILSVITLLYKK